MPARNEPPQPDIQSLLSQMQTAITTQIQKVQMSLDSLSGRVDRLENDASGTAEQLRLCQASLSSSSSSTDSEGSSKKRKRHVAPDISVSIHDFTHSPSLHVILCFRTQFGQCIITWQKRSSSKQVNRMCHNVPIHVVASACIYRVYTCEVLLTPYM